MNNNGDKKYISYEDYVTRYCGTNGSFFTGYVVGYGYVYPKASIIFPSHLHGFGGGSSNLSANQTHNIACWQYAEDRSPVAVNDSYGALLEDITGHIIKKNPDNSITVNMGLNTYINIPKEADTQVNVEIDSVDPNRHLLRISVRSKDDSGNGFEKVSEIPVSDLKMAFNSNLPVNCEKYELEQLNAWYPQTMGLAQNVVGGTTEILNGVQNVNSNPYFWRQKNGTYRLVRNINNNYLLNRSYELSKVRNATSAVGKASRALGGIGAALTMADIGVQGAIKPSHAIGLGLFIGGTVATLLAAPAVAGAFAVVGTVYFIVDVGMMIFSDKFLSERIDEGVGKQLHLWEPLLPLGNQYQLQTLPR